MSLLDRPRRVPWSRSHRFTISGRGSEAEAAYRDLIVASRSQEGRASFDSARADWAKSFNLHPDDGLYLAEVGAGPVRLHEIVEALESCGKNRKDAIAAMERLVELGLISAAA